MDWDDIRLALAIARSGSLSRAAIVLDVNQSTVGRRLTALEASIGTTLFLRSKNGLLLTESGEVFAAKAAEIEQQTESLLEVMKSDDNKTAGLLRLLSDQWIVNQLIRSGLDDLLREFPMLEIRAITERPETSLWRGEPGVGLWFDTVPLDGAFQITLGSVPFAVYQKRGMKEANWVSSFDEKSSCKKASEQDLWFRGGGTTARLTALGAETLHEAVAIGIGRGLLPICLGNEDDRIERTSPSEQLYERTLYCHIHPDTVGSTRVQTFLAWLRTNFNSAFRQGKTEPVGRHQPRKP